MTSTGRIPLWPLGMGIELNNSQKDVGKKKTYTPHFQ